MLIVDVFSSTLFDIMEITNSEDKSSLIIGDVNICLLKYGINDKISDFVVGILYRVFLVVNYSPTNQSNLHISYTISNYFD